LNSAIKEHNIIALRQFQFKWSKQCLRIVKKEIMNRLLLLTILSATTITISSFVALKDDGRAGNTGSPGEATCGASGCHTSFTVNSGPGSIYLTSNMNNWEYVPGQTYTVNAVVKYTGRSLFGIGLEALTSTNTNAGTIVVTNSAKTQIKAASISGVSRNNLVHQLNGGTTSDSSVFTFNWIAPSTNIGNITFYFAGVCANANTTSSGDYVYNSSKIVTPAGSVGVPEISKNSNLLTVINLPGSNLLHLSFDAQQTGIAVAELYDIKGSIIASQDFGKQQDGTVDLNMDIVNVQKTGLYIVKVIQGSQQFSKKIALTF
jgi:hypothetical protein